MNWTSVFSSDEHYCRIYVIRDAHKVTYVGLAKSSNVGQRLAKHLESSVSKKPSKFARLLRERHPAYFQWEIEILDAQACGLLVGRPLQSLEEAEQAVYDFYMQSQRSAPEGNVARPSGKPRKQSKIDAGSFK